MKTVTFVFSGEPARADKAVSEQVENLSRSACAALLESGSVLVNGAQADKKQRLKPGDTVEITLPDPKPLEIPAQNIDLDIRYEDNDLLVVNKPKGMVVHPAPGNPDKTLVNALLAHCRNSLSGINGVARPGIVHRIDKDTSGLLIVAKNDFAHAGLAKQIKEHSFLREYEAVVYGVVKNDSGTICAPIGRHPVKRKQMAVTDKNSREAVTHYQVLERMNGYTHVRLRLETGRTHQIRVHMAYIAHPVAGDPVYAGRRTAPGLDGQCLHARRIGFVHPVTGEYLDITSELPDYFQQFLIKIKAKEKV